MTNLGEKLLKKWNYQQTAQEIDFKFQTDKKGLGLECSKELNFLSILDQKYNSSTISEEKLHSQVNQQLGSDSESDNEYRKKVLKKKRNL
jgi:hypothetical protein